MTHPKADWEAFHRRLRAVRDALKRRIEPPPEEQARVLRSRARELAREEKIEDTGAIVEVIEFRLAEEHYAIESAYVREVLFLRELTPLPCTPAYVLGLANVRGQILTIIDIRKFFDLPERGLTDLNRVILLQGHGIEFGILADAILDTRTIPLTHIGPAPATFTGIRRDYLKGVTPERVAVLDGGKLLGDERIVVREEVI
jgi:purine-binding chemotaxis protein CheW